MSTTEDPANADLRARINALEHSVAALGNQLTFLDQWRQQVQVAAARDEEKWKNVDKRFDDLDGKIEKVSGILSKIMWLVISGIVMAFVAFLVRGGFNVP